MDQLNRGDATVSRQGLAAVPAENADNQPANGQMSHFDAIRAQNPAVARAVAAVFITPPDLRRVNLQVLQTLRELPSPTDCLAAFFDGVITEESAWFWEYANAGEDNEVVNVLRALAQRAPHKFLMAVDAVGDEERLRVLIQALIMADGDDSYPLLASTLIPMSGERPVNLDGTLYGTAGRQLLAVCDARQRGLIASVMGMEAGFYSDLIELFDGVDELFSVLWGITRVAAEVNSVREKTSIRCMIKLVLPWLEGGPYDEQNPRARVMYMASGETFIRFIQEVCREDKFTAETRTRLLYALDPASVANMNGGDLNRCARLIGALMSLAQDHAGRKHVANWVLSHPDYGNDLYYAIIESCSTSGQKLLMAYCVFCLEAERTHLAIGLDGLTGVMRLCSRVPVQVLRTLTDECCPELIDLLLRTEVLLEGDGDDQQSTALLDLLSAMAPDEQSQAGPFLTRAPVALIACAMRHPQGQLLLAACYQHFTERVKKLLEELLPDAMTDMPVMLPYVQAALVDRLPKMEPAKYRETLAGAKRIAQEDIVRINESEKRLRRALETEPLVREELVAAKADHQKNLEMGDIVRIDESEKRLKQALETEPLMREELVAAKREHQKNLEMYGDRVSGVRKHLQEKRERDEDGSEEGRVLALVQQPLKKLLMQHMAGEPLAAATQLLIVAAEPADDADADMGANLNPFIFNHLPNAEWRRLPLCGVKDDEDLAVLGMDEATQTNVVEAFRQRLVEKIPDGPEKNKIPDGPAKTKMLEVWRKLPGMPADEQKRIAKKEIVPLIPKECVGLMPALPAGVSLLLPETHHLGKSPTASVLWVVAASPVELWKTYCAQPDLEAAWQKMKGTSLKSLKFANREELLAIAKDERAP